MHRSAGHRGAPGAPFFSHWLRREIHASRYRHLLLPPAGTQAWKLLKKY